MTLAASLLPQTGCVTVAQVTGLTSYVLSEQAPCELSPNSTIPLEMHTNVTREFGIRLKIKVGRHLGDRPLSTHMGYSNIGGQCLLCGVLLTVVFGEVHHQLGKKMGDIGTPAISLLITEHPLCSGASSLPSVTVLYHGDTNRDIHIRSPQIAATEDEKGLPDCLDKHLWPCKVHRKQTPHPTD